MRETIEDILNRLRAIPELKYVAVWNNQLQYLEDQTIEAFPFPCAFVELVPQNYNQLEGGYQQSDIDIVIHIGHEEYDANNGYMEQNLSVFDVRNLVVKQMALYRPVMCSELFKITEEQDYTHTGVYHYKITYLTGYIDKTASTLIEPTLIDPIDIEIDVELDENLGRADVDRHEYKIINTWQGQ
jgi:hypothetical protein